ncbi:MAG: class I SAM-dependent RNA methyltransferase [Pelagibacterales bacterium]|nr:class I SAM-dependent RNA methyltransferase [Pelagibacterales bacterium]
MGSENNLQCRFFNECGGCDFLDLSTKDYQNLKIKFLEEIFAKNKIQIHSNIEYNWFGKGKRRKITLQVNKQNKIGFFAKKSHVIVEIDECIISEEKISKLIIPLKNLLNSVAQNIINQITITSFDSGIDLIFSCQKDSDFSFENKIVLFAKENKLNASIQNKNGLTPLFISHKNQIFYSDFKIDLASNIFIQATKNGLEKILELIDEQISGKNNIADIYSGFGAYTFSIAQKSQVTAFEGSEKMIELIKKNTAKNSLNNNIKFINRDLFSNPLESKELNKFDLAIINPPRNGATPQIEEIAKSKLNHIIYVSCNPITFTFDAKILVNSGFKITKMNALDQFYGSKHLELVAILKR